MFYHNLEILVNLIVFISNVLLVESIKKFFFKKKVKYRYNLVDALNFKLKKLVKIK